MSAVPGFVLDPGTKERTTAKTIGERCTSEAGYWLCTRVAGHDEPHQAGAGYDGSDVYAEWAVTP